MEAPTNDSISRQAAIHDIEAYFGDLPIVVHHDMLQLIKKLPPTQTEQKTGKWVNDGKGLYKCTACGELWLHWWATVVPIERMYKEMQFCPHCGAKMYEKETEDEKT